MSRLIKYKICVLVAFFLGTLVVGGCHTTPVPLEEAIPTPLPRLMAFQSPSPSYPSTLTIIRDKGFGGSSCYIMVYINNELAARMDAGEKAVFHVPAGNTLIMVGPDTQGEGLCWLADKYSDQIETYLNAQEKKPYRVSWTPGGVLSITRAEGTY